MGNRPCAVAVVALVLGCGADSAHAPAPRPAPERVASAAADVPPRAVEDEAEQGTETPLVESASAEEPPAEEPPSEPAPNEGEPWGVRASRSASGLLLVEGDVDPMELPASRSTSVGGPNDGGVVGAVGMPLVGPGFRFNPRRPLGARFGTVELVQSLMRAAAAVEREMPGSELWINDLGLQEGGPIRGHGSHQAGRDVDTLFFYLDDERQPIESVAVPVDPRGVGWDFKDLEDPDDDVRMRLDLPRTWRFAQAMIEDDRISINRIFLAEHVRTLLLEQARRARAPRETVRKFESLTCQPSHPHDDHFHFRLFCTAEDIAGGCRDTGPIYYWHRQAMREAGAEIVRAGPRRRRPAATTTSAAQAREAAGPMHWRVQRFLAQRAEWEDPPRTGRPYCR